MKLLVTGGAGFVGSNLALNYKTRYPEWRVMALDNLKRRGSELQLPRLKAAGVEFIHGDVRQLSDLFELGPVDLLIECSAEPSVHAGYGARPDYLIDSNLKGALNCLEYLRQMGGKLVFLSTSRVYPIENLRQLPLFSSGERLDLESDNPWYQGISEDFGLKGPRSLYGATKLSAELMIDEYRAIYGIEALVLRCGVLTGPWQMGKVDQGFLALWLARHFFGGPLNYTGFGGKGFQVRDLLHVDDLFDLLVLEPKSTDPLNVGGGRDNAASLAEISAKCRAITGSHLVIGSDSTTRPADIPWYITNNQKVTDLTGWSPKRNIDKVLADMLRWLEDHRELLRPLFTD